MPEAPTGRRGKEQYAFKIEDLVAYAQQSYAYCCFGFP